MWLHTIHVHLSTAPCDHSHIHKQEQNHVYGHQTLSPSPTNVPTPGVPPSSTNTMPSELSRLPQAQSLPATPTATNVRTFLDYSGEHTRLTTLHGSTGALEVNNLGGFKLGPIAQTVANNNSNGSGNGSGGGSGSSGPIVGGKLASAFESTIVDGMVKFSGSNGTSSGPQMNGHAVSNGLSMSGLNSSANSHMTSVPSSSSSSASGLSTNTLGLGGAPHDHLSRSFSGGPGMKLSTTSTAASQHSAVVPSSPFTGNILNPPQSAGPLGHSGSHGQVGAGGMGELDDEISDVFHGLSFRDPLTAAPGYGRSRLRRSSAPVANAAGGSNRSAAIQNGYGLWGGFGGSDNQLPVLPDSDDSDEFPLPPQSQQQHHHHHHHQHQQQQQQQTTSSGFSGSGAWGTSIQSPITSQQNIWGGVVAASVPTPPLTSFQAGGGLPHGQQQPPPMPPAHVQHQQLQHQQGSRPSSQTSSYSGSNSDQSGFSPVYSPTGASGFGGFSPINGSIETSCGGLLTTGPMFSLSEDRETRSPFKVSCFKSYQVKENKVCLLYTSPSPRDATLSRMPSSA